MRIVCQMLCRIKLLQCLLRFPNNGQDKELTLPYTLVGPPVYTRPSPPSCILLENRLYMIPFPDHLFQITRYPACKSILLSIFSFITSILQGSLRFTYFYPLNTDQNRPPPPLNTMPSLKLNWLLLLQLASQKYHPHPP